MKIEHLGIAVKSLGVSDELFAKLLGKENYKQESVEREGVTTSFYEVGESKIELLEATNHSIIVITYRLVNQATPEYLFFQGNTI